MANKSPIICDETINILDHLTDGIIITDENLIIQYVNDAYIVFLGVDKETLIGSYLPAVRPTSMLPEAMKNRQPMFDIPRKAGNLESYCDFIPLLRGEQVIGGMVVIKDVIRIKGYLNEIKNRDDKIYQLDDRIKGTFRAKFDFNDIIGARTGLKKIVNTCHKIVQTDSPVLLIGESGTGKEVFAQAIHNGSNRRNYPFVDINCAAIPENLLESELFGYEEGAFTGSKKGGKIGLFEIANRGTLFLDEITEMPMNMQSKLLRVLQEQKLRKIGGRDSIELDVRIIAATNKNIIELINQKAFREDLYYRLAVFIINIPPLRQRKSDIRLFIDKYIKEEQRKKNMLLSINNAVYEVLENYSWPGNVRELKNAIEYACNITDDGEIKIGDLPRNILKNSLQYSDPKTYKSGTSLEQIIGNVEKEVLELYLNIYGHSVEAKKGIAYELNISMATLYNKIKKYKLERAQFINN